MTHSELEPRDSSPSWDDLATLDGLASVIDPLDGSGVKNRVIDRLHKRALARTLGPVRGKRVLDYGCGVGRLSGWLVDRGATVWGVDPSARMLERARTAVPGARFVQIAPDALPEGIGQDFDLVLTVAVLQYLAGQQDRLGVLLTRLAGVLRSGGQIAALEHVHDGGIDRGAPIEVYETALREAGMALRLRRPVRVHGSVPLSLALRFPMLARLPGLAFALEIEARRARQPLVDGRYADCLFLAVK